jgi:hypothetical protein
MAILSYERKRGRPLVRGWIVSKRLLRRKRRREVCSDVDSAKLALLIVSTLEGSFMIRGLQKNDGPLDLACHHLEEYFEMKIRVRQPQTREGIS